MSFPVTQLFATTDSVSHVFPVGLLWVGLSTDVTHIHGSVVLGSDVSPQRGVSPASYERAGTWEVMGSCGSRQKRVDLIDPKREAGISLANQTVLKSVTFS